MRKAERLIALALNYSSIFLSPFDGGSENFFNDQLGYTKKQEERHFRGVIILEVQ
jgi:hypothetical protein